MTKTLLFDIETAPNLGFVWGKWQQDVIEFDRDWYILCFCSKWLDKRKITCHALPNFKRYDVDREDDKRVVKKLWKLFDEADILVAHHGDPFDVKKANARFVAHDLPPPSPYKTVDTVKVARKHFKFDSNKLDELGRYLGIGRKLPTTGFALWKGCMEGDKKAWAKMVRYNRQDVKLLEEVYLILRPWMPNHPNVNILSDKRGACPTCGENRLVKRGQTIVGRVNKRQNYQCRSCGAYSQGKLEKYTPLDIR